jgi:hypothetical protein
MTYERMIELWHQGQIDFNTMCTTCGHSFGVHCREKCWLGVAYSAVDTFTCVEFLEVVTVEDTQ